jgi:cytochrome P450
MAEGDGVLVVLAAANRDPLANPLPEAFDVRRLDRRLFTFGAGPHACPGETLAAAIAQAGVAALLASGLDPSTLLPRVTYRPSANARIPLFDMIS